MNSTAAKPQLPANTGSSIAYVGVVIIRLRRSARRAVAKQDRLHDEARRLRRSALALRTLGSPFDRARILELEKQADQLGKESCKISDAMRGYGKLLMDLALFIDTYTTLDERCDLLNVNIADRSKLSPEDGVVRIVFAHGLEDSAERRHCQWNDGPLFRAAQLVFADFLLSPECLALRVGLFQPGGLFERVPTYSTSRDGTLKRNPPKLRMVTTQGETLH
ncbi:hypothetical protein [Caballeronia sp. 15711]|uniref:hypothetical protein n=1 Tax=Caballeronia sp. 15711 TaxID=3391029 RepID=UPI0039E59C27